MKVNAHVLIPRPETEGLAERAWQFVQSCPVQDRPVAALDFGTGSGCIAIALAVHAPAARVWALDLSADALAVARANAVCHAVAERIEFVEGAGFAGLTETPPFQLIVSNPPYIPSLEIERLAPEVRDHDPRLALDGGLDGLSVLREIAAQARGYLTPGGTLMCEFGDGQSAAVRELFEGQDWHVEAVDPDLSGRPRYLLARLR
jgi:release factor glutamine methyltransferase